MSATSGGNGNGGDGVGLWKVVAISLITFTLGLLISGGGYILRAPTRGEVDRIAERQQVVLQRLAAIDAQIVELMESSDDARVRAAELERLVRDHIVSDPPNR